MTTLYADSSALARAYFADEQDHGTLRALLLEAGANVITCEITRVELASAVAAASRAGCVRDAEAMLDAIDRAGLQDGPLEFLELDRETVLPAAYGLVQRFRLRALDAIHLAVAAAEAASGEEITLVTRDADQAFAARALGLTVL